MKIKDINVYEAVTDAAARIEKGATRVAGTGEKGGTATQRLAGRQEKMSQGPYAQRNTSQPKDVKYNAPEKYPSTVKPSAERPSKPYPADARPKYEPKDGKVVPKSTATGKDVPTTFTGMQGSTSKAKPGAAPRPDFRPKNVVTPKSTATGKEVPTTFDPKTSSLAADYIKAAEKGVGTAEKEAGAVSKSGSIKTSPGNIAKAMAASALAGSGLTYLLTKDKDGNEVVVPAKPEDAPTTGPNIAPNNNIPNTTNVIPNTTNVIPDTGKIDQDGPEYRPSHLGPGEKPAYDTEQKRDDYVFPVRDHPTFKRDSATTPIQNKVDPFANVDWEATAARERLKGSPGLQSSLKAAQGPGPGYSSEPLDLDALQKARNQRDGTGDNDKTLGNELPPIEDRSRWAEPEPKAEPKAGPDLTDKKYQRGTVGTRSPDEIEWDTKHPYRGGQYPGPGWQEKEKEQGEKNWENLKALGSKLNPLNWFKEDLEQFNRIKSLANTETKKEISESHVNQTDMRQMLELMYEASKMADIKGKKHTGSYGKEYDTDEEGDEKESKAKKAEPAEKKGRGRPKKDSTVDAGKWKGADDAAKHVIGGKAPKNKSNLPSKKHTLKDWIDSTEEMIAERAKNKYAIGMAAAKKQAGYGSKPAHDLPKKVIKKGHEIAKKIDEADVEESGLQAYLGNKKYGKDGMDALRKAGREGASKEKMAKIRAQHDKMDEAELKGGQKNLDVAEPKGKLDAKDFAKLRAKKNVKEGVNFSEMMRETQMGIEEMLMELQSCIDEYKATGHMNDALRDALDLHRYSKKDKIMGEAPMMPQPVVEEPVAEGPFEWAAKQAKEQGKDVFKFGGQSHPVTVREGTQNSATDDDPILDPVKKVGDKLDYAMRNYVGPALEPGRKAFVRGIENVMQQFPAGRAELARKKADPAYQDDEGWAAYRDKPVKEDELDEGEYDLDPKLKSPNTDMYSKASPEMKKQFPGAMVAAYDDDLRGQQKYKERTAPGVINKVKDFVGYDKPNPEYGPRDMKEGSIEKSGPNDLTGTWSSKPPKKGQPDVDMPVPMDPVYPNAKDINKPKPEKKTTKENTDMDKQFEGWASELDSLLNENITINTNTSSDGNDSVTVTATEGDAGELIALLKNAGMGGIFGDGQQEQSSPYGAPMSSDGSSDNGIEMVAVDGPDVIDGGDSVLELIKKMTGLDAAPHQSSGEDYADEVPVDNAGDSMHEPHGEEGDEGEEEEQTEKGHDQEDHDDEENNKEVDEAYGQTDEGNKFTGNLMKARAAGQEEADLDGDGDMEKVHEADEPMCNECGMNESECGCDHVEESFENEPDEAMKDIEFMTNFITGGLNRQKRDQTTLPHTSVKVTESKSKDVLYEWKKLSGIK